MKTCAGMRKGFPTGRNHGLSSSQDAYALLEVSPLLRASIMLSCSQSHQQRFPTDMPQRVTPRFQTEGLHKCVPYHLKWCDSLTYQLNEIVVRGVLCDALCFQN